MLYLTLEWELYGEPGAMKVHVKAILVVLQLLSDTSVVAKAVYHALQKRYFIIPQAPFVLILNQHPVIWLGFSLNFVPSSMLQNQLCQSDLLAAKTSRQEKSENN